MISESEKNLMTLVVNFYGIAYILTNSKFFVSKIICKRTELTRLYSILICKVQ